MLHQSHTKYKFPVLSTPWRFNRQETISTHPINSLKATEMWLLLSCGGANRALPYEQPPLPLPQARIHMNTARPNETSAALMTNSGPAHQRKRGATVSLPEQSSSGSHCDGGPGSQHTGPGLCKDGLLHTKRTGLAMSCQYQGVSVIGLEAAPETEHSKSCEQHWLSVFYFEKTWNLSRKSAEVILEHFKRCKCFKKEESQRTRSASIIYSFDTPLLHYMEMLL